jgi:hypothetical protein
LTRPDFFNQVFRHARGLVQVVDEAGNYPSSRGIPAPGFEIARSHLRNGAIRLRDQIENMPAPIEGPFPVHDHVYDEHIHAHGEIFEQTSEPGSKNIPRV